MKKKRDVRPEAPDLERRKFLGQASCAAVGTTALFNTVLNMKMFNVLACGDPGEYRARLLQALVLVGEGDQDLVVTRFGD